MTHVKNEDVDLLYDDEDGESTQSPDPLPSVLRLTQIPNLSVGWGWSPVHWTTGNQGLGPVMRSMQSVCHAVEWEDECIRHNSRPSDA